jgi:hypothetical protein
MPYDTYFYNNYFYDNNGNRCGLGSWRDDLRGCFRGAPWGDGPAPWGAGAPPPPAWDKQLPPPGGQWNDGPVNYWGFEETPSWDPQFNQWGFNLFGVWVPM